MVCQSCYLIWVADQVSVGKALPSRATLGWYVRLKTTMNAMLGLEQGMAVNSNLVACPAMHWLCVYCPEMVNTQ